MLRFSGDQGLPRYPEHAGLQRKRNQENVMSLWPRKTKKEAFYGDLQMLHDGFYVSNAPQN